MGNIIKTICKVHTNVVATKTKSQTPTKNHGLCWHALQLQWVSNTIIVLQPVVEATNISYKYFSHNGTAEFVREFFTLDSGVQQAVVKALTQPRIVRTILHDPAQFYSVLCLNRQWGKC